MASKERRERNKDEVRRKILAAAQQIISAEGFAALSMRKLADRIEYSPASIYLHFRSREQIAQELGQAGFGELYRVMSAAVAGKNSGLERMNAATMAYVDFGLSNPETYRLIFMGDAEYMAAAFARQADEKTEDESQRLLTEIAEAVLRDGRYPETLSAEEMVLMIWGTLHGMVSLQLACAGFQFPAAQLVPPTIGALLKGLAEGEPTRERVLKSRSRKRS